MPRLIETKEPRPEHSTVINWTVPVYIKNGEDYYKVCFDIRRKPLSDGTLELTESELEEFNNLMKGYKFWHAHDGEISGGHRIVKIKCECDKIICVYSGYEEEFASKRTLNDVRGFLYLAERFDLTEK